MIIYCVHNNMTKTYGTPFVAADLDHAMLAVCEGAQGANLASVLTCSELIELGTYDQLAGSLKRYKSRVAASSVQLMQYASGFFKNFERILNDSIDQLLLMRDYFNAKKESGGGVCDED